MHDHNDLDLNDYGLSPVERLTGIRDEIELSDFHTWGCTTFVLDERNQSSLGTTPKWDPKSKEGLFLGRSSAHAGNVALVLNLETGHVSPQHHVVFDDNFSTIGYLTKYEASQLGLAGSESFRRHRPSTYGSRFYLEFPESSRRDII